MQIWSQKGVRAGLYPVTESSVYWFITFDCDGQLPAQSSEEIKAAATSMVLGWEYGIQECVKNTPADKISRSRFFDKWPLPVPTVQSGCFTLVGDGLHPMTPNLGQVCVLLHLLYSTHVNFDESQCTPSVGVEQIYAGSMTDTNACRAGEIHSLLWVFWT
jgi:hypothetical protein